jgi:hypothetical protein
MTHTTRQNGMKMRKMTTLTNWITFWKAPKFNNYHCKYATGIHIANQT